MSKQKKSKMREFQIPVRAVLDGIIVVQAESAEAALEPTKILQGIDNVFFCGASVSDWEATGSATQIGE